MIRWLLLIPFALLIAIGGSGLFFLVAAAADPVVGPLAGNTLFVGFWALMDAIVASDNPDTVIEGAVSGVVRLAFTFFVLPPVFITLVSEAAGLRRLLWHAGATALLSAAMPWLLRGSPRIASPDELRISLVLGLAGAVAGFVYWLIAGRSTGAPRSLKAA